jgi:serine/threonine-protein kinase
VTVGSDPRLGGEIAGYRLVSLLGRGGMGAVYLSEDMRLGRKVALKLLAPQLTENRRFRERFLRESQLAASLDHPHVVPVYAAGEAEGQLYLAMRYVDGYDLKQLLTREGKLSPARALTLLGQVAEALDAAHERGLVHRDVKPGNVLIAARSGREHCYLADFGLTKQTASISGLTGTGELVGTVEYVSPEQIRGDAVDRRSDVYALACVLHECLTGEPPFERDSEVATLWAHVNDPPGTTGLGRELDAELARGLAKNPQDRHGSCGELLAAAGTALGFEAAPLRLRRRRFTRARVLLALAVLAAVAVAGALALRGDDSIEICPLCVGVLDPATGRPVGAVPMGFTSHLLAAGEGYVWAVDARGNTIRKIDPDGMEEIAPHGLDAGATPVGLAVGSGSVWVAVNDGRSVALLELGPDFLDQRESIELYRSKGSIAAGTGATELVVERGTVWALEGVSGGLWRIDAETGKKTKLRDGLAGRSLALSGDSLWLAGGSEILRLDATTGDELDAIGVQPGGRTRIAAGERAVWFVDWERPRLHQIDPDANATADSYPVTPHPSGLAVGEGAVWVAAAYERALSRFDPQTGEAETIDLGVASHAVVVAEGRVWTSPGEN